MEGLPESLGVDRRITDAAFELTRNGELFDEVIEAADGYHVIMRIGKRSAREIPLEEVRGSLEQRVRREGEERARKAYFARLEEQAEIHIDHEAIVKIAREIEEEREKLRLQAGMRTPRSRERADGPPRLPMQPGSLSD